MRRQLSAQPGVGVAAESTKKTQDVKSCVSPLPLSEESPPSFKDPQFYKYNFAAVPTIASSHESTTGQEQKSGALTKITDTEEDHGFSFEERHHLGKIRSSASGGTARSLLAAETSQRPSVIKFSIKSSDRESQKHDKFEVDFASAVFHPIEAEGNQFPVSLQTMKEETPDGKIQKVNSRLSWSSIEMDHFKLKHIVKTT